MIKQFGELPEPIHRHHQAYSSSQVSIERQNECRWCIESGYVNKSRRDLPSAMKTLFTEFTKLSGVPISISIARL